RNEHVRREEAARAQQMKRLVHAAAMIKAVVVPALLAQLFDEGHVSLLPSLRRRSGRPMRIVAPSAMSSANANGPLAHKMIVEPLSNQPSSSPCAKSVRLGRSTFGPR